MLADAGSIPAASTNSQYNVTQHDTKTRLSAGFLLSYTGSSRYRGASKHDNRLI